MHSIGKDIEVIVFDSIYQKPFEFIRKVNRLNSARLSPWSIIQLVRFYWRKLQALDNLERLSHKVRPPELQRDATTKAFQKGIEWIGAAKTLLEVIEAEHEGLLALRNIPQDLDRQVVRMGLVGEIYVLLESAINLEIEEMLGNLGVEVDRSIYLTGWTRDNTWGHKDNFQDNAKPYLGAEIGGHAQESIGHAVMYAEQGFDAIIQLAPFTCIPEIVSKTIMPSITRDKGIPVLTFFLDEQTAKAGVQTRLEALVDMVKRRNLRPIALEEGVEYARVSGD